MHKEKLFPMQSVLQSYSFREVHSKNPHCKRDQRRSDSKLKSDYDYQHRYVRKGHYSSNQILSELSATEQSQKSRKVGNRESKQQCVVYQRLRQLSIKNSQIYKQKPHQPLVTKHQQILRFPRYYRRPKLPKLYKELQNQITVLQDSIQIPDYYYCPTQHTKDNPQTTEITWRPTNLSRKVIAEIEKLSERKERQQNSPFKEQMQRILGKEYNASAKLVYQQHQQHKSRILAKVVPYVDRVKEYEQKLKRGMLD